MCQLIDVECPGDHNVANEEAEKNVNNSEFEDRCCVSVEYTYQGCGYCYWRPWLDFKESPKTP